MSFQKMEENVLNISALDNKPKISAAELKAMFDAAGVSLKTFVNNLIDELSAMTAATHIGADVETVTTKTLQAVLNAFESSILERYTKNQTETLVGEATNDLIKDFSIDLNTGVITITKKDGTKITFDTALEKVPATFELIEENEIVYLKITNVDGTTSQVDVTTLFNEYEFLSGTEIAFSQTTDGKTKKISANIRDNSIGKEKLKLELITEFEGYVSSARDSAAAASISETNAQNSAATAVEKANSAKISEGNAATSAATAATNAKLAQSYAKGGTGARDGEDTDNAEYYARLAQEAAGGDFLARTGDASNTTVAFTEAAERSNILTGEKLSVIFGKIKKWFSELYTKNEINNLLATISTLTMQVVTELPAENISATTIYLVPNTQADNNIYDEYIYINSIWEKIGTTEVNLSEYATTKYVDDAINTAITDVIGGAY